MKITVYVDVLLAVNLFLNYFLLLATARFTSARQKRYRILLGAAAGSLLSFLILAEWVHPALLFLIRLLGCVGMILLTFGFSSPAVFLKTTAIFLAVNFVFAGLITAVWYGLSPPDMLYRNGVVYLNLSPMFLFVTAVIAYGVLRLIEWILQKRVAPRELYTLKIVMGERCAEVCALYDTGNRMTDSVNGMPVTVCELGAINNLLSYDDRLNISSFYSKGEPVNTNSGLHFVPYHTVGKNGLMACLKPDRVYIRQDGAYREIQTEIGVVETPLSQGEYRAILQPNCLNR